MELVGYQLVDGSGNIAQKWGGEIGSCPAIPNPVILPNGDQVCGMTVGQTSGEYTLQAWMMARDLIIERDRLKAEIDRAAGMVRKTYLTDIPGQDTTYDRKRREALVAIDDPSPTETKYPLLFASIGIEVPDTGNPKTDCDAMCALVKNAEDGMAPVGGKIERLRLGGKKAVNEAQTVEDAQAIANQICASLMLLKNQ